jgi:hypothetical protein
MTKARGTALLPEPKLKLGQTAARAEGKRRANPPLPSLLKTVLRFLPAPAKRIGKRGLRLLPLLNAPLGRLELAAGVRPLSYLWGSERGKEIARYYLEQFLQQFI